MGVATTVINFRESLARLGDSALSDGNDENRFSLLRRSVFATPAASAYVARLKKTLHDLKPDVIHTNGFKMHLLGALAKPRAVPLVWHIHDYLQPRQFMSSLMKLTRGRCAAIIVNSNSVGLDVKQAIGNGLSLQTVHNGINTRVFAPQGERLDLDSLAGLSAAPPGTIRVGLPATLALWKGHKIFLQALALIDRDLPLRGYIIGDALYQTNGSQTSLSELKQEAARLGIAERVGLTGFVTQPAAALRSLDIVVHASTEPEPFGLVVVEAMSCGRAVIVSAAGGVRELIEENINALVFEQGNAAQLAERITQLAGDPILRARLGAAGRLTATQRFDRQRLAAELVPLYRSLASAHPRGSNSPSPSNRSRM
jgi:glycosyltransferase involved in cell wall biosynthesis